MTTSTYTSSATFTGPRLNVADWIALALMIVGAINWGLVGVFDFNLVAALLGEQTMATRAVYILVALAGLYALSFPARLRARG